MSRVGKLKVAIVGIVGVPAAYGGFETLVERLLDSPQFGSQDNFKIVVYCSSVRCSKNLKSYKSAQLKYIPLDPNGGSSIAYDLLSLIVSAVAGDRVVLMLGVSAGVFIPIFRLLTNMTFVVNVDGVEWKREKWGPAARWYLRLAERLAAKYANILIADNKIIGEDLAMRYDVTPRVVTYGGDHVLGAEEKETERWGCPSRYFFSVCRIEPENNIHIILSAFSKAERHNLVLVGNWAVSSYAKNLYSKYSASRNIFLLPPIYDLDDLQSLRAGALCYIHGHSAGGTNPSLVEAMWSNLNVIAFDCGYNRETTGSKGKYFADDRELTILLDDTSEEEHRTRASNLFSHAQRYYSWDSVADQYFSLLVESAGS